MKSILFTQCLQNDFVQYIEKFEPIPNQLHVGYLEAKRLLGETVETGPVNLLLEWAYEQNSDNFFLVHIRDWHDPNDSNQADHLKQFGNHCIQNTHGADFVFSSIRKPFKNEFIVNASGLNDFYQTNLEDILKPFEKEPCRIGIAGVWTEAKVTYLAYELKTRYPNFEIATCSLITAGSSRSSHFIALENLENILGIQIFTSLSKFTQFLNNTTPRLENKIPKGHFVQFQFEEGYSVSETDQNILQYLFRDARSVEFTCLDGGFSGNVVLKAKAKDKLGHYQVPYVIKIGKREPISKERIAFERIQEVLGNNAPSIIDFAELGERGAIKYRYASMLGTQVQTFQKYYASTEDINKIQNILEIVFRKQLGKLYDAKIQETVNLLEYYDFNSKYAASVRTRVEELTQTKANTEEISLYGKKIPNVCFFYEKNLQNLKEISLPRYMSYVHGDLNGANIIIDDHENVWLIDFFHVHKGHILKDLVKLENDILYIFMKIEKQQEWEDATELVDLLISTEDLRNSLPNSTVPFTNPKIQKALGVIKVLRSFYSELIELDRDPYQLWVAQMRYAMHTTTFEECNEWQKKLALYAGSKLSKKIEDYLKRSQILRIDSITVRNGNRIGLTILPGRKDRLRNIIEDVEQIKANGYFTVLCLVTLAELEEYGVNNIIDFYSQNGITVKHLPILDQGIPTKEQALDTLTWMREELKTGNLLIHCVGGLGRSGTLAALYLLQEEGFSPVDAIQTVRKARSPRAIESKLQEEFLTNWKTLR